MSQTITSPPKPWYCSVCDGELKEWTIGLKREEQAHPECRGNRVAMECLKVFRQALQANFKPKGS